MKETNLLDFESLQSLLETIGGDWTFMAELADEFFVNSPALLGEMRSGLAAADAALVRRAAHSLKGTSASFGALELSQLCKQVEYAARDGVLDGLDESLSEIETNYRQVEEALRTAIARGVAESNDQ